MDAKTSRIKLNVALLVAVGAVLLTIHATGAQRRKNTEPKEQVLPLPPELPLALLADTQGLDFHLSPLERVGGLSTQIRHSLNDLIRETKGETIVKLRAFVAGAGDARRVQAEVSELFTERKLPLPVLTIIQVGALGTEAAQVVIEAVVSTHRSENPNGLAFVSGQTGNSFTQAFARLRESAAAASIAPDQMLRCTCFTSRLDEYDAMARDLHSAFPAAGINLVQAVRDPANENATCEAVGRLNRAPDEGTVVLLGKARATLVHSPQLVFTGMQLTFGSFLDDAHEAVARLEHAASALQPIEAPVEFNAFSLDAYAGSAIRKNASVPPSTFTVQRVEGLPAVDASAGIEAVLAPNVAAPVTLPD